MIQIEENKPFNIINPLSDLDGDGLIDMYDPSVMDFDLFNNKLYVEPVKTLANKDSMLNDLNVRLNNQTLSKLTYSQMVLESGNFKYCYNYNYTNIKKSWKNNRSFTMYSCSEIYKGKEYHYQPGHIQSCFVALSNQQDGINFYLDLLSNGRYKKVLQTNNPKDFVHELKVAGFFTANEELYFNTLNSIFKRL